MGTNYFAVFKICECCGQEESIHLGKASKGWKFLFQGDKQKNIVDFDSWIRLVQKADHIEKDNGSQKTSIRELLQAISDHNKEQPHFGLTFIEIFKDQYGNEFTFNDFS